MKTKSIYLVNLSWVVALLLLGMSKCISQPVFSDTIVDGSFEVERDLDGSPFFSPPWAYCGADNSPDYQPGKFNVSLPPYHGDHYVGMVQKGGTNGESVTQRIRTVPGENYFMVMYLASSPTYYHQPNGRLTLLRENGRFPSYNNVCNGQDTLWISPSITENRWKLIIANFQVSLSASPLMMLQFKVLNVPGIEFGGNILIDSIAGPFLGAWPSISLGEDQYLCEGDSVVLTVPPITDPRTAGTIDYLWEDGSNELSRTIYTSGQYSVCSIWNSLAQCDTVALFFEPQPAIALASDTILCDGDTIDITASVGRSNYSYLWNAGEIDSTIYLTTSRNAVVEATNGLCSAKDSVTVLFKNCEVNIEFPNVFTPNSDGVNDIFRPMKITNIQSIQIDIYDRWGRPVTTLNSLDQGWDGRNSEGIHMVEGVYFWVAKYAGSYSDDTHVLSGNISLIR